MTGVLTLYKESVMCVHITLSLYKGFYKEMLNNVLNRITVKKVQNKQFLMLFFLINNKISILQLKQLYYEGAIS